MLAFLYGLCSLVWGLFSMGMQSKLYPAGSTAPKLAITFIVNALIFPISLIWATYCLFTDRAWATRI